MSYEPLRITAWLRCGVVSDATLPIDAVLLYTAARDRWGGQEATLPGSGVHVAQHGNLLPLKRVHGAQWYYHASFAQWSDPATEGTDHWNKRLDMSLVGLLAPTTRRRIDVGGGRYRSYHMPVYYRHALRVWWYVCGERTELARLLSMVTHLGKKAVQGWGRVIRWELEPMAEDWSIRGPQGQPMRAIPVAQADGASWAGFRPSYWDRRNQGWCVMPLDTGGSAW